MPAHLRGLKGKAKFVGTFFSCKGYDHYTLSVHIRVVKTATIGKETKCKWGFWNSEHGHGSLVEQHGRFPGWCGARRMQSQGEVGTRKSRPGRNNHCFPRETVGKASWQLPPILHTS